MGESFKKNPESVHSFELLSADELVDRQLIENHAKELIATRSLVESNYKSDDTYLNDSRTLIFEALTARGHLSCVEISGTLEEIHAVMVSVLLNAWDEEKPLHEQRRNFQELCEELTIQAIERKKIRGEVPWSVRVATISDFVVDGAMSKSELSSIGYRASNKKGMVRDNSLIVCGSGHYTRRIEQVSRSNADSFRSQEFLAHNNVTYRASEFADVSVLGTQLLHELEQGVVGLQQRLDEHQGTNIRYGEQADESHIPYEQLREVSAERESIALCYVEKLAIFTKELDSLKRQAKITEQQYDTAFKQEVAQILRAICVMDPSYAVGCFGKKAVAGFVQASNLTALGDYAGAAAVVDSNRSMEEMVTFCGKNLTVDEAKNAGVEIDATSRLLQLGANSWKWKKGVCRVTQCPTRPTRTEVGPCSVCRGCQHEFNMGRDPSRTYRKVRKTGKYALRGTKGFWQWLSGSKDSQESS